jgi:hypothetical protein
MKKFSIFNFQFSIAACLLLFSGCAFTGCSYLRSKTIRETLRVGTNDLVREVTVARAFTLWEAQSGLTKFRNSAGGPTTNYWTSGTSIGSLNQQAESSNAVDLISAVARGVAAGLK